MSKKKEVKRNDKRFAWTYNRDACYDNNTDWLWILKGPKNAYPATKFWFITYQGAISEYVSTGSTCTNKCVRKETAIRALMRLINRMDNGKC